MEKNNPELGQVIVDRNESLTNPQFVEAFLSAYEMLLNLSYSNDIVASIERRFPSRKQDVYILFHQLMNNIRELLCAMEEFTTGVFVSRDEILKVPSKALLNAMKAANVRRIEDEDYDNDNDNDNNNNNSKTIHGVFMGEEPGEVVFLPNAALCPPGLTGNMFDTFMSPSS